MNTTNEASRDALAGQVDRPVRPAWADCESRGPWARNGLAAKIDELRHAAKRVRKAYRKDFMAEPCRHIADAYDEAADALQARLDAIGA